jgi:hypothetical protein
LSMSLIFLVVVLLYSFVFVCTAVLFSSLPNGVVCELLLQETCCFLVD